MIKENKEPFTRSEALELLGAILSNLEMNIVKTHLPDMEEDLRTVSELRTYLLVNLK